MSVQPVEHVLSYYLSRVSRACSADACEHWRLVERCWFYAELLGVVV